MYLPSNSPIPLIQCQRAKAAAKTAASAQRVMDTRQTMAAGRIGIFETIVSPEELTSQFGIGLGVNAAKHQDQTEDARATGMLGVESPRNTGPSLAQLIADAPEVVSLNRRKQQAGCTSVVFSQDPVGDVPTPSMPHGAPNIVNTTIGPMYYRGPDATYPQAYPSPNPPVRFMGKGAIVADPGPKHLFTVGYPGLTGLNPPWSDAWVMPQDQASGLPDMGVLGWIQSNPWLSLAIAAGAVLGVNEMSKRGRK